MRKLRKCEELVTGNGHKYLFSGTIRNIEAASFLVGDPGQLLLRLSENEILPKPIRDVIYCTLEQRDGAPVDETRREEIVAEFVDDFGLQDCSLLARTLIGHALIGNVKKNQIARREAAKGMVKKLNLSSLTPFGRRGLLWGTASIVLIVSACTISN